MTKKAIRCTCGCYLNKIVHKDVEGLPMCTECYIKSGQWQKDITNMKNSNQANGVDIDE